MSGYKGGRRRPVVALVLLLAAALAVGAWWWTRAPADGGKAGKGARGGGPVPVVSALAARQSLPVRLTANGTVTALQSVEIRPRISATVREVHVREGQSVRPGERLFTLDTRIEAANQGKAEAQIAKDRADLANAERNLARQRELFERRFVSQAALDAAQNQVDALRGQLAVDQAAFEATRVTRGFGEIVAPIAGRTGTVSVFPGSLVQPTGDPLLTITRIDPIDVTFTLPERELPGLQQALAQGAVAVEAAPDGAAGPPRRGRLAFVDNAVDAASGTIRLKARFDNPDQGLWPGMFVKVALAPRTLADVVTVPVQAVQTGPERKFVYAVGADAKVTAVPVSVRLIQDGRAVVDGVAAGTRVVVEGAQHLRPGGVVTEGGEAGAGKGRKGEGRAAAK